MCDSAKILFSILLLFFALHGNVNALADEQDEFIYGQFPSNFMWGTGTSAYQIEGGWNIDGKGENIWDNFTHQNPSPIKDGSNGDIACDSYHKYEEDVQLVKNTGVDFYRFSISWSRILPDGTTNKINQAGIDYYNKLIDSLIQHKITPVITIFHWDLELKLQSNGGWLNDEIIDHFGNFARLLYQNFGDRVKRWLTFNEAWVTCVIGYGTGEFAPGVKEMSESPYICIHNILKAHARAYRIYTEEFKTKQKGFVGITIDSAWLTPLDPSNSEDIKASERALQFKFGMFANPIVYGDYPELVKKLVDERSKKEGRSVSRLPAFDAYWSEYVKGTYDFIGLNHYSTYLVRPASNDDGPGWFGDQNTEQLPPEGPKGYSSWLHVVPWGLRRVLNWIKDTYDNPPLVITENGYSDYPNDFLNDQGRIEYFKGYINNVLKAVIIDGCDVRGYSAWSLMDNFAKNINLFDMQECRERFGLHWVNFTDPNRERIPKKSVAHLKRIFLSNGFPRPKLPWEFRGIADEQCDAKRLNREWSRKNKAQMERMPSCGCGG